MATQVLHLSHGPQRWILVRSLGSSGGHAKPTLMCCAGAKASIIGSIRLLLLKKWESREELFIGGLPRICYRASARHLHVFVSVCHVEALTGELNKMGLEKVVPTCDSAFGLHFFSMPLTQRLNGALKFLVFSYGRLDSATGPRTSPCPTQRPKLDVSHWFLAREPVRVRHVWGLAWIIYDGNERERVCISKFQYNKKFTCCYKSILLKLKMANFLDPFL